MLKVEEKKDEERENNTLTKEAKTNRKTIRMTEGTKKSVKNIQHKDVKNRILCKTYHDIIYGQQGMNEKRKREDDTE